MNDRLLQTSILVTGGGGFLGTHVLYALRASGATSITALRRPECDLRNRIAVRELFAAVKPQVVIHLAALVGGIGANKTNPKAFLEDNMAIDANVIDESIRHAVSRFAAIGSTCMYPKNAPLPFREESLRTEGPIEETNLAYATAKRLLLDQLDGFRDVLNSVFIIPPTLYGPGDNFDLETSHVVSALVRRFMEAKARGASEIILWGSGAPTREFLFVQDAGEIVARVALDEKIRGVLNIGAGGATSIAALARAIADLCGYSGEILWDRSKPDGQIRRALDSGRMKALLRSTPKTDLTSGLRNTIEWYRRNPL